MVSTPQRHQHRKDAPVKEQRILSAAGDRLTRALDEISVRAGADSRHRAIRMAYVSCSLREHEVHVKVQQASLKNADIRTTMNIYTQAIPKAVREAAEDDTNPFHPSCRDATVTRSGVYKIDAKTRRVTALATKADGWPFCFPDDVTIDSQRNVYMSDLTYSAIWKISPDGKRVDIWSSHPLLNWSPKPYSGNPQGVNDLVLDKQQKSILAVTDGDPMVKAPYSPISGGSVNLTANVSSGWNSHLLP
jgi:hypothetical protein